VKAGAQRREPAVDANARGGRARAERRRDVGVAEVLEHAQAHRLALLGGQRLEALVGAFGPALVGHGGRSPAGVQPLEDPEPAAGAALELAAAKRHQQDVARDPEQPRRSAAVRAVLEPRAHEPGLGERLGGQVVCRVVVARAAQVVAEHALGVAVVELAEGARVGAGGGEQGGIAAHGRHRHGACRPGRYTS
jgi:hypothetical protein